MKILGGGGGIVIVSSIDRIVGSTNRVKMNAMSLLPLYNNLLM